MAERTEAGDGAFELRGPLPVTEASEGDPEAVRGAGLLDGEVRTGRPLVDLAVRIDGLSQEVEGHVGLGPGCRVVVVGVVGLDLLEDLAGSFEHGQGVGMLTHLDVAAGHADERESEALAHPALVEQLGGPLQGLGRLGEPPDGHQDVRAVVDHLDHPGRVVQRRERGLGVGEGRQGGLEPAGVLVAHTDVHVGQRCHPVAGGVGDKRAAVADHSEHLGARLQRLLVSTHLVEHVRAPEVRPHGLHAITVRQVALTGFVDEHEGVGEPPLEHPHLGEEVGDVRLELRCTDGAEGVANAAQHASGQPRVVAQQLRAFGKNLVDRCRRIVAERRAGAREIAGVQRPLAVEEC